MRTVKVELDKSLDSIEIYTLADWHIGDKYCNISEIKDTLNYIKNTPNAYAILIILLTVQVVVKKRVVKLTDFAI